MYFIGFTGATTKEELTEIKKLISGLAVPPNYQLNAGILFSDHTIYGVQKKSMFPAKDTAYELLKLAHSFGWEPAIHFNTNNPLPLSKQVEGIFEYETIYENSVCQTIQLNKSWPDLTEIEKICQRYEKLKIIFQVNMWDELPRELWLKIGDYLPYIERVLFDASGGRGKYENTEAFLLKVKNIVQHYKLNAEKVVLAGGLGPDNVAEFYQLAASGLGFPNLSLDAQGRLRGRLYKGRKVGDKLNPQKVYDFINATLKAMV